MRTKTGVVQCRYVTFGCVSTALRETPGISQISMVKDWVDFFNSSQCLRKVGLQTLRQLCFLRSWNVHEHSVPPH